MDQRMLWLVAVKELNNHILEFFILAMFEKDIESLLLYLSFTHNLSNLCEHDDNDNEKGICVSTITRTDDIKSKDEKMDLFFA